MRTTIAASLFLAAALSACGSSSDPGSATGTSDCQQGVRVEGATFIEVGHIASDEAAGDSAGQAALGECDDQGEDPAGLTFPQDADTVEVWTVTGAEPQDAVALKTDDGLQVFVSEALSEEERRRVAAQVGLEE